MTLIAAEHKCIPDSITAYLHTTVLARVQRKDNSVDHFIGMLLECEAN